MELYDDNRKIERRENIEKQDNQLIYDILNRNYYKEFSKTDSSKNIALIINRTNKNSQCYGCFNNTEKLMYPSVDFTENDYNKIYENLSAFLKFYVTNKWKCPIELIGIDWTNEKICDRFLILLQNFTSKCPFKDLPPKFIINTDFHGGFNDEDILLKWRILYENFKKCGIDLFFNIYANGLYCDDNQYSEKYYNKLIEMIKNEQIENSDFKIIAYVRPNNIKNWIKNYDWWIKNLNTLAFTNIELREEKTDKWTYDLISEYILFLNYQIDYLRHNCNNEQFLSIIFNKLKNITFQNINLLENHYLDNENKNNNCNFFKNLTIDLTSMNIVPCPKVNYKDFACGQYIIKDGNIDYLKAKNIPMIIYNTHLKQSCLPHCELCKHIELCQGHCLGESYNKCYDMLVPIKEFCDLSKAKINFLIYKYNALNILTKENMAKFNCNEYYIRTILNFVDQIKEAL